MATEIKAILVRAGMALAHERLDMVPLSGGVSSDIWRVRLADRTVCVKRALGKLKVRADWNAPVERNLYECRYLEEVAAIRPGLVPRLLFRDEAAGAIVMEFMEPDRYRLWKEVLLDGDVDPEFASRVGHWLGRIHRTTALDPRQNALFSSDVIFHSIRLEPYLLATGRAHPDLERSLARLARRTASCKLALVHGDVSPKNILIGPHGPVLLDAECAWFGDPAFDLAFCLNHLLLKCIAVPARVGALLDSFDAMVSAYMDEVIWEPRLGLEARAASLLPALLLARIDGKSPVEYITSESQKLLVRNLARPLIVDPQPCLALVRNAWLEEVSA